MPTEVGVYYAKCMEREYKKYKVTIKKIVGQMCVNDPQLGTLNLQYYHDGLTDLEWCKDVS